MIRAVIVAFCFAACTGCMADQQTSDTALGYACTATRACMADGACTPSDLEFNLSQGPASDLTIRFADGSATLSFVEVTSANAGGRPISLNTFEDADQSIRLTLAEDGLTPTRARLQLLAEAPSRDISATCVAINGPTQ